MSKKFVFLVLGGLFVTTCGYAEMNILCDADTPEVCESMIIERIDQMGCFTEGAKVDCPRAVNGRQGKEMLICDVYDVPNCSEVQPPVSSVGVGPVTCASGEKKNLKPMKSGLSLIWRTRAFGIFARHICVSRIDH